MHSVEQGAFVLSSMYLWRGSLCVAVLAFYTMEDHTPAKSNRAYKVNSKMLLMGWKTCVRGLSGWKGLMCRWSLVWKPYGPIY